jgi:hypothetical protein
VLICILNNVLDMGRNVLFIIRICRCILFVWALCVSWLDLTWTGPTGQLQRYQPSRYNSMVGINVRVWQLQYNLCCCVSRPIGLAIGLLIQFRILHITERNKINNKESYLNLRLFDSEISGLTIHIKVALRIFRLGDRNSNFRSWVPASERPRVRRPLFTCPLPSRAPSETSHNQSSSICIQRGTAHVGF